MAPETEQARVAEVHALARRLEARGRREKNKDLMRAGTLLRILLAVMADENSEPCPVLDLEAHRRSRRSKEGRMH